MTKRGHTYTPSKTRDFEGRIKQLCMAQYPYQPISNKPITVTLIFNFSKPRKPKNKEWHIVRPDIDNLCKSVCDAANGILWDDDSQICELYVQKKYCREGTSPMIVLTFSALGENC